MFRFNIPITKVDEEQRLVYGLVTEEVVDQSGEILDYESSKKYFQEWSDGISKATGGASLGNLRLMHQPTVAGKIIELVFDDVLKQISCVAKIVSNDVWDLVLEGCLTGFSMGGKYIKRWKDAVHKNVHRFTAKPLEVSVVDNPCVSTATFEYIKSDGSTELRKFHSAGDGVQESRDMFTQEQIAARAAELAKSAGTPDAADQFLDEALVQLTGEADLAKAAAAAKEEEDEAEKTEAEMSEEAEAEKTAEEEETEKSASPSEDQLVEAAKSLVQVWQAPDGATFAKKNDGALHVATAAAPESVVEKALREAREATVTATDVSVLDEDLEKAEQALAGAVEHILPLTKGLYEVRELAHVLQSMRCITTSAIWEAKSEGDGSRLPSELMELLRGLGGALVSMTQEEVAEMLAMTELDMAQNLGVPEIASIVELAAMGDMEKFSGRVEKAGARNSSRDRATIQKMHDQSVELGADCDAETEKSAEADVAKALEIENDRLKSEVTKAVEGITELGDTVRTQAEEIAELRKTVEKFGKTPQPLPPRTGSVVVERNGKTETITADSLEKMSNGDKLDLMIRLQQMQPTQQG